MSALGVPVLINPNRSYWLSSIGNDTIHSTIKVQEIDAVIANISTANISTLNADDLAFRNLDLSGLTVSSINANTATLSTLNLQSGDGVNPFLTFTVDPSGVRVDGCPIIFNDLVYLTSTINIIQVSTLVDTDIFAQNGYFSTISSLQNQFSSVQVGDLSGNTGKLNQLTVSSLIAGDISGVDLAEKWSLYPTLNSSITFQPGFVLSNIGNELFFAGNRLTDVSGGGEDWSRFPAFSTVQFANNSAIGISTLQFQDGGKLYSLTGNNLFYNNNQINTGAAGAASNWAAFPAVQNVNMNNSTLSNALLLQSSNLNLTGSNITNGNTFTGTLGVGGLSLVPLASINSLGQGVLQDLDVGTTTTSIGDLNVYGVNALPGDNALYVLGGTTLTGGLTAGVPVHGTEIGALPVAGVDTVRIDVLPVGMGFNSATYIQLAAVGAGSFAAGGALSLAGGDYVEINTDDCRIINTTSGNQSTTLTVANIQMPGSVAASVPLQINNTAGGGINLVGTSGVGQIAGFSSITGDRLLSPFISTNNINLSSINGINWDDISGGGGGTVTDRFSSLFTSSLNVSSITVQPGAAAISIEGPLKFQTPNSFQNVLNVNTDQTLDVSIFANRLGLVAFDTYASSVSSINLQTSNIRTSTLQAASTNIDVSGSLDITENIFLNGTLELPLATGGINFDDGSGINYTRMMRRDIANNNMVSVVNSPGLASNNMEQFGVGELWVTGGADQYSALRIYNVFPYDNFGMDIVDENGTTLFEAFACGQLPGGFLTEIAGVSSITGYRNTLIPGSENAVGFDNILTAPTTSTQNLLVSSINGAAPGSGGTVSNQLSTLFVSSLNFSTALSFMSNTSFNYPLFIEADHANNISTAGVAIAVQGHNFGTGMVRNQVEMGARATGENYIMASWPGANLEELFIDATDVTFRDGSFSTIINLDPYGVLTTGIIQGPYISTMGFGVSSINNNDARPAYTNNIQTSTMELYTGSTTLMYWDNVTTSSNINTSGYDTVIGLNGVFKIGASFQFLETGAPTEVEYFVLKNDAVLSQAGGITEVTNNQEIIQYFEVIEPLVNGDKIQIGCFTNGTTLYVSTINGNVLQSPAVILTCYKIN
jgi:hypothetical protein